MKTGFVLIGLTVAVASCGQRDAEGWSQSKAQCAAGAYEACAEIGHQARAAMGGTTLERDARFRPLSVPIID